MRELGLVLLTLSCDMQPSWTVLQHGFQSSGPYIWSRNLPQNGEASAGPFTIAFKTLTHNHDYSLLLCFRCALQARARHATLRLIHLGGDVQAVAKTATGQVTLFPVYLSSFYTYITLLEVRHWP